MAHALLEFVLISPLGFLEGVREGYYISKKTNFSPSKGIFLFASHLGALLVTCRRPSRPSHIRSPSFRGRFFHFPPPFLYGIRRGEGRVVKGLAHHLRDSPTRLEGRQDSQ